MKQPWFVQIYQRIEKYLDLKIPFEIVYFPSTGITSAFNRYAEMSKNDPAASRMFFIVDFRVAQFNKSHEENKEEFFRVLKSHLEHTIEEKLKVSDDKNIYQTLKEIFNKYLKRNQKVLLVFRTSSQINLGQVPEFKDFLIFLDQLRDVNKGNINILLTSTNEQFDDQNPAPIPIISKFHNYYDPGMLYRTVNEDILNHEFHFRKIKPEDVLKMIEITGGNVGIIKALARDFTLQGLKINQVHTLKFDANFFADFINCKIAIDRIKQQLDPTITSTIKKISLHHKLNSSDNKGLRYLQQTGALDENGQMRSAIITSYCQLFCNHEEAPEQTAAVPEAIIKVSEKEDVVKQKAADLNPEPEAKEYLTLNSHIKIHTISGEITLANSSHIEHLSEKELQIFLLLYQNANKEVSREQIGKTIWTGPEAAEYSDWAIDKLISRIREKLTDVKPYRLIKTLRKKGFMLIK